MVFPLLISTCDVGLASALFFVLRTASMRSSFCLTNCINNGRILAKNNLTQRLFSMKYEILGHTLWAKKSWYKKTSAKKLVSQKKFGSKKSRQKVTKFEEEKKSLFADFQGKMSVKNLVSQKKSAVKKVGKT